MVLMTDGTVLVHYVTEDSGGTLYPSGIWEQLTPDAFGNYTDGTWTQLPAMPSPYAPLAFASAILPDGRLLVEGGEYNGAQGIVNTGLGAIYDPFTNTWTSVNPPGGVGNLGYGGGAIGTASVGDAQSAVLPSGQFMLGDCCGDYYALFDAGNLSWTSNFSNTKYATDLSNTEEGWVLLPSGQVLTVDLNNVTASDKGKTSMLYTPGASPAWSVAGNIPVSVADTYLRRNGSFDPPARRHRDGDRRQRPVGDV